MRLGTKIRRASACLFLLIMLVITVFPLLYTVSSSFKTNKEIMNDPGRLLPAQPTFDNYKEAWNSPHFQVGKLVRNSIYYTLSNVVISIFVASMGGYVFARGRFRFKKAIFACFTSLMFIKLGGISIYPTFQVLNAINLTSSLGALILVNAFGVPIVNIYLVKGYVATLPAAIEEAAKIDGCNFAGTFFKIIAPLLKPIMATIGILSFQGSWNDYLMPTIFTLNNPNQQTLIVGLMALKNSDGAATSWNLMLAGATIALIPVLAAYAIGNRYFISGLAAGAVKG